MKTSIILATHGDDSWKALALARALPSTVRQGAHEVIVRHKNHATLAQVRNAAAEEATGDFLVFLDADDALAPGYLWAMARTHATIAGAGPGPFLLAPALQYVSEGRDVGAPFMPAWEESIYAVNSCCIGTLWPREFFASIGGFRNDLPIYEDFEIVLRAVVNGARIVAAPEAVYRAWLRSDSRNNGPARQNVYAAIRQQYEQIPPQVWEQAKVR